MIGKLKGVVDTLGLDQVLIDVQGVCYLAFCSGRTLANLSVGSPCALHIMTHVREDHIHLYGFESPAEKEWFDLLTSVQGVGPRLGLAILSTLAPTDIANALALEDKRPFQSVSGVGPKVAARLVTELKEKSPAGTSAASMAQPSVVPAAALTGQAAQLVDVRSALTNLGYDENAARTAAQQALADLGEDASLDELIPAALKALMR